MYDPNKGYSQQSGYAPQPGYVQPGYPPQAGYMPQQGYSAQPGFAPRSGVEQPPAYGMDSGMAGAGFSSKEIRMAFIRKVYSILFVQLAMTVAVAFFMYQEPAREWVQASPGVAISAYVTFIVLNFVLLCCEGIRRQHPLNLILLGLFTLSMAYLVGVISCIYKTESVMLAFGICAVCCLAVTLFSFNTKYDFTSCAGVLFVVSIAFMIFGFVVIFSSSPMMHKVYAGIGAIVFMLFLAFDTQTIIGGKKLEISPEDHVFASMQLYMDVIQIFLFILQLFGERKMDN